MMGGGKTRLDLSVTLSIHNTSEKGILVIERIDYFNVAGQPIDKYLPRAIALKPYGAIQIVVPEQDIRGGLGANFVVDWSSPETIDEPIVEAVMTGGRGTQGYSDRPQRKRSRVPKRRRFLHSIPRLSSISDAWGRLNVVTPFHHLSGDSHLHPSLAVQGPLRHLD